jgi:ribosomal protein L2
VDDDLLYMRKDFGAPLSPSVGETFAFDSHPSGWAVAKVVLHENGHVRVARGLGCSARVVDIDGRKPHAQITSGPPLTPPSMRLSPSAA